MEKQIKGAQLNKQALKEMHENGKLLEVERLTLKQQQAAARIPGLQRRIDLYNAKLPRTLGIAGAVGALGVGLTVSDVMWASAKNDKPGTNIPAKPAEPSLEDLVKQAEKELEAKAKAAAEQQQQKPPAETAGTNPQAAQPPIVAAPVEPPPTTSN